MTAEIAILNKSAVALAADSAVTLEIGGTEKIYNTADKLFELSSNYPVGAMIFNSMSFLDIPLEAILKEFRGSKFCEQENHISGYSTAFLDYLAKEVPRAPETTNQHVKDVVAKVFGQVIREFEQRSLVIVVHGGKDVEARLREEFLKILDKYIGIFESAGMAECFSDLSIDKIFEAHENAYLQLVQEYFERFPLKEGEQKRIKNLFAWILASKIPSDISTGLVIAGFGSQEIFPSLQAYTIDGIIADRLKISKKKDVDIDRNGDPGDIIPFAQKEMVDRFLYGIDSEFEDAVEEFLAEILDDYGNKIIDAAVKRPKHKREQLRKNAELMRNAAVSHFRDQTSQQIRNYFKSQILHMVLGMPKQELAHLAESLVNLTSTKRRVSAQQETVGGPIDVAVISRGEGFVWVKRKHYFDAELNPRYFYRKFGRP